MTGIPESFHPETLERLRRARRVVALTGAGVSAESGIPTFRGDGGLWRTWRPEDLATPEAFSRDPVLVWEWYLHRRQLVEASRPNPAHTTLALWESVFPRFTLVTQNVDGLHRRAGSRGVIELHGNLFRTRCARGAHPAYDDPRTAIAPLPPRCGCGAPERPDVVWFGEGLPLEALERAIAESRSAEVFLAVGTSGIVQPAATLPILARRSGAWLVEINPDPTPITREAHESVRAPAGVALPALNRLLGAWGESGPTATP